MPDLADLLERLAEPTTGWGTAVFAGVAALVAMLAHGVIVRVLRRLTAASPIATAILDRTTAPGAWLLPLVAVQAAWEAAPDGLRWIGPIRHLNGILLVIVLAWGLMAAISGIEQAVRLARPVHGADDFGARRLQTQMRVLARAAHVVVVLLAAALVLTTFPAGRSIGASLLASAGLAGIVAGFAARPVLGNLIAGLQIGLSQPIRLDDVVIVEGEWGTIEEITGAFVVVRVWDERRLIVPLQWWIEKPFQNWTRASTQLLGTVLLWVDYRMPIGPLRDELARICAAAPEWDGRVQVLQVTEAGERALQVRALVSAPDAGRLWDLRCRVREALVAYVQREFPDALPRLRADGAVTPSTASAC